ncbi:MAG TPA: hypothetical protein VMW38_00435 [Terriglobia bacterium]|nr:hypothetical protein [Terriglobia bacterium]
MANWKAWEFRGLVFLMVLWGLQELSVADTKKPARQPVHNPPAERIIYHYRMAGRVRLLLFWVGKEDVGGGSITFSDQFLPSAQLKAEGIEVLFGSNPKQVPGRINRWGYGQEWSYWKAHSNAAGGELQYTVFTGFMRHSDEDALSQVYATRQHEQSAQLYWYDGIESVVRPWESVSNVRHFAEPQEFDYQQSEMVQSAYRQRLDAGPPDKTKVLKNGSRLYSAPYGFLTCMREVSRQISNRFQTSGEEFLRGNYSATYAYNAKTYILEVTRLKYHPSFFLPEKEPDGEGKSTLRHFSDVAEVDFRLHDMTDGSKHDFSLWFPLRGDQQGVPLRILDKPRWWLQVDLRLASQSANTMPMHAVQDPGLSQ